MKLSISKITQEKSNRLFINKHKDILVYTVNLKKDYKVDAAFNEAFKDLIRKLTNKPDDFVYTANIDFSESSWKTSYGGKYYDIDEIDLPEGYTNKGGQRDSETDIEVETFNRFQIFVRAKYDINVGKSDDYKNDCRFDAISKAYNFDKSLMPRKYNKPYKLKKMLGIARDDGVHIGRLPELEDIFKCSFTITGDACYKSTDARVKNISMTLLNGHYELVQNADRKKIKNYIQFKESVEEDKILVVRIDGDSIELYDGLQIINITTDNYKELRKDKTVLLVNCVNKQKSN